MEISQPSLDSSSASFPQGKPSGVVAFLFTDIEGSTRKWESDSRAMSVALRRHDDILRSSIEAAGGYVFKTVGDAFCAAFHSPQAAACAAIDIQRRLSTEDWPIPGGIKVRMAMHAGQAEEREDDYFGPTLNRVARILSLVYGAQVVLSLAATELLRDHLDEGLSLKPMGRHRLKDLERPEELFQLCASGLSPDFPPPKDLDSMPHNLPLQPNPLLGRRRELDSIAEAFDRGGARLVTLTGMGGAGKTRLALQAAAELLDDHEGGAWFVDLSECTDRTGLLRELGRVLSVRESPGTLPEAALAERLAGRQILLVLDNLEQDPEAPALVADLLETHPGLSIIATSRQSLNLRWERAMPLSPLPLPGTCDGMSAEALSHYDAVALFIERAKAARPSFTVDDRNAPAVAELCLRLDGVPLAVELAAARIAAFSPEEMLRRLGSDLAILSGGADLPERHRSIKAVIGWSYGILPSREARAFRALAEFRTPFDLDRAETLLGALDTGLGKKAMELVAGLVGKSLLVADSDGEPTRYRMLSMLRAYGRSVKSDESPARAHAALFLELAGRGRGSGPAASGEAEWYSGIDRDYPDYATAWDRLAADGDGASALRLATGLWRFWHIRGAWSEGVARIEGALAACGGRESRPVRAGALRGLGSLLRDRGELERAASVLEEAGAIFRDLGDTAGEASSTSARGWCVLYGGGAEDAMPFFERSRALAEGVDEFEAAAAIQGIATVLLMQDRFDESRALHSRCIAAFRRLGELSSAARATENLAILEMRAGDAAAARSLYAAAHELYGSLGDREGKATVGINLGWLLHREGAHDEALHAFGAVLPELGSIGALALAVHARAGLSACMASLGRNADAVAEAEAGLAMLPAGSAPEERGLCLRALGEARAALGFAEASAKALEESEAIFEALGDEEELRFTRAAMRRARASPWVARSQEEQ